MSIGNQPSLTNNVAAKTISVTASGGQTLFTVTGGYRINQISVYRNGTRLVDSLDYTARDGATVTLLSPASTSDVIEFQVFDDFRAADALNVNSGGTVNGNVTVTGSVTAGSFSGNITGTAATFTGNVTVGGTLTYEDVTNIDSVGLITARSGAIINTGTATTALIVNGDARVTGILTIGTSSITLDGSVNQVNVGTGVTIHHTNGVQVGGNTLHSTGLTVNNLNSSGIITSTTFRVGTAVTINSSGITVGVITATTFSGDGSGLTGVGGTANVRTNTLVVSGVTTVAAGSTAAPSVSPTGDSNTGIFFPAADTVSIGEGGVEALRVNDRGQILLGVSGFSAATSPTASYTQYTPLHLIGGTGTNNGSSIFIARNTPSTNAANQDLGSVIWGTNDGAPFARIGAWADGTPTGSSYPGYLSLQTTASGATTPTERLRITSSGVVSINEASPPSGYIAYTKGQTRSYSDTDFTVSSTRKGTYELFSIAGSGGSNSDTWADQKSALYVSGWLEGGNPGEAASVLLLKGNWSGATNPGYLIKGFRAGGTTQGVESGTGTVSFRVRNDGNVTNTNNSYGAISDQELKENIIDCESQWNDIKQVKVRKFQFKQDIEELDESAPVLLGVVAQELEQISPGLVETPPDYDKETQLGEPHKSHKSVKYSVLYMKAIKALQEAQERIETLESQVLTLAEKVNSIT